MSRTEYPPAYLVAHKGWIDLGLDHAYKFFQWAPDRDLNPQYAGIPDIPCMGASVCHLTPKGEPCMGAIHFDSPALRLLNEHIQRWCAAQKIPYAGAYPVWQVKSFEPLWVTPSLHCNAAKGGCGDHGHITQGRWVKA